MHPKLKILHLEDVASDAELVERELKKSNIQFELSLVDSRQEFEKTLKEFKPDIILSDHSLPSFSSGDALKIVRDMGLKIPFILITATVSEEFAVRIIKEGAEDYILKDRLQRLPSAVLNAIRKRQLELEKEKYFNEVKNSEERFRDIFENAPSAILVLDAQTQLFLRYNTSALKLLKYSPEELLQKKPADVSPAVQPDGQHSEEKVMKYIGAALNGEKPTFEWTILDAKRQELICEARLVKLSGADNNQVLISFVDITERKNAEQMREKITADLVLRNKELEQFAYVVSHNLRAPLTNIMGLTALLEDRNLSEQERNEFINHLTISANNLDNIIIDLNQILNLRNNVNEKRTAVKFSEIVEDIKISIYNLTQTEEISITTNFSQAEKIFSLKTYIYSIFYNLIINSIKYKQPNLPAVINVRSYEEQNKLFLVFKDNGLGIDLTKNKDQVFGLYKRFHPHIEGKGTGLFMVKTAVEMLGGTINIASAVNKGTIFTIQFPIT